MHCRGVDYYQNFTSCHNIGACLRDCDFWNPAYVQTERIRLRQSYSGLEAELPVSLWVADLREGHKDVLHL